MWGFKNFIINNKTGLDGLDRLEFGLINQWEFNLRLLSVGFMYIVL